MPKVFILFVLFFLSEYWQGAAEMHITGVYQGKSLFIQNPYNPETRSFCVLSVEVNGRPVAVATRSSGIKLDFAEVDEYAPLAIKITHKEGCKPLVINPDAINFHSIFSFDEVGFADSVLVWSTKGEQSEAVFVIQKYDLGIWLEADTIPSKGQFGGAEYSYFPDLEEGANKLRVKYMRPDGEYLFSREVDFHFYPEPVTFRPFSTDSKLFLSRFADYEIFDAAGDLVMSGKGNVVDVSQLPSGDYVIYFNKEDPGVFRKK